MRAQALESPGVDLVEYSKAASFYRSHRSRLKNFFTPEEFRYVRASACPHQSLAHVLAAKEAVFKSLGEDWMGPGGFKKIRILPSRSRIFGYRVLGQMQRGGFLRGTVRLYKTKQYVVATCVRHSQCAGI